MGMRRLSERNLLFCSVRIVSPSQLLHHRRKRNDEQNALALLVGRSAICLSLVVARGSPHPTQTVDIYVERYTFLRGDRFTLIKLVCRRGLFKQSARVRVSVNLSGQSRAHLWLFEHVTRATRWINVKSQLRHFLRRSMLIFVLECTCRKKDQSK